MRLFLTWPTIFAAALPAAMKFYVDESYCKVFGDIDPDEELKSQSRGSHERGALIERWSLVTANRNLAVMTS